MRKLAEISAPILPLATRSHARRPLASFWAGLTCLVLVRHQETEKALFVSDDDDVIGAVWVPKAMLVVDPKDRGPFVVATMSLNFAREKRLQLRFIDPERFCDVKRDMLKDAVSTAARTRLRLAGHQDALPFPGRNAFA